MSFEFQSTLVNVTPSYRIAGNQIGGVRIEMNGGIKVARVIVTNDADVKFAPDRSLRKWRPRCNIRRTVF